MRPVRIYLLRLLLALTAASGRLTFTLDVPDPGKADVTAIRLTMRSDDLSIERLVTLENHGLPATTG